MKQKRIFSAVLATCMLSNFVMQAMPVGAISIFKNTESEILITDSSGEEKVEVATATPVFIAETKTIELGENTIEDFCGDEAVWTYDMDSHVLVINGNGSVLSLVYKSDKILDYLNEIETIIVEDGIISLNEGLFEGCTSVSKLILPFAGFNADGTEQNFTLVSLFGSTPENMISITINGGTMIPDNFCYGMNSLTEIVLADSIVSIGASAFEECNSITEIIIPADVEKIGENAFDSCSSLTNVVFTGTNLKSIGQGSFSFCDSLTEIILPDGVETIENDAFYRCTSLNSVCIPASTTFIGNSIFYCCEEIKNLSMPAISIISNYSNSTLENMFYYTSSSITLDYLEITGGISISKNFCGNIDTGILKIADSVTEIGDYAFSGCSSLAELVIPSSVTTIGNFAFSKCSNLTEIVIPESVKTIGECAFADCTSVTSISIAEGTETIGYCAFSYCTSAESILLPSTLKEIGAYAFRYTRVKELTIPAGVTNIGDGILYNCNSVQKLVLPYAGLTPDDNSSLCTLFNGYTYGIPETLTSLEITGGTSIPASYCSGVSSVTDVILNDTIISIGEWAFYDCNNLLNITMSDNINNVGEGAFSGTAWYNSNSNGVVYAGKVALSYKGAIPKKFTLKFRDDTIGIADNAFYDQDNIISVKFPENLEYIGNNAFSSCNGITSVEIPDSVISLGSYAFADCSALSTVELSENITHIGSVPFNNTLWDGGNEDGAVYIGKVFVGYKGEMPKNTKLVLEDDTTEIADNALENHYNLISITIPDTVTSIGNNAFSGCSSLEEIVIPDSVTELGKGTFSGCSSLQSINIPPGIKEIKDFTFDYCGSLSSIVIPYGVEKIRDYAFGYCDSLTEITIPDTITEVSYSAYSNINHKITLIIADGSKTVTDAMTYGLSNSVDKVTLPETLQTIGKSAFYDFKILSEIEIPEKVDSIGCYAFYNCNNITKIIIPDTVTEIGARAFSNCSSLQSVNIPPGIKEIKDFTFDCCGSLLSIAIPHGVEKIGDSAFGYCDSLTEITIPDTITEVSYSAYSNINHKIINHKITLIIADGSETVTSVMTKGLENIVDKVVLPETLQTIDEHAFYNFKILSEIEIPEKVDFIGREAFRYCYSLTKIIIPENVKTIGSLAFYDCSNLTEIVLNDGLETIGGSAFSGCSSLQTIVIPDTVTELGEGTFSGCSSLQSVNIPPGIKEIKDSIFYGCSSLSFIVIPHGVEKIGNYVFSYCYSLTEITIPDTITEVGNYTYEDINYNYHDDEWIYDDRNMTLIIANGSETVTSVMTEGLEDIVDKVVLPETLQTIDEYAFRDFESLTSLTIPESVTKLTEGLCYNCSSLETVTLPSGIDNIPDYAFYGCSSLKEIVSDVQEFRFRSTSFKYCDSLFDTRFMVLDKRNINLSANTDKSTIDGIINFSLSYKLTPFIFENGAVPVMKITIPDGMTLLNADSLGFDEYYSGGYSKELTELNEVIHFSARVEEFGNYSVSASLDFSYDGENWNEPIGKVDIASPSISLSVPKVINTTELKVKGFAKSGEKVTIYADGKEVSTVIANEKTGKYHQTIKVAEKQNGESYEIYASVADESTDISSVIYEPKKPMVETVYLNYNGDSQHMDITSAFTEGKRPVISINPSYPFEFEIEMSNSDNISKLFITSKKGDETKSIEAFWNSKDQIWVAFGYFDPNNHSYIPGSINISVYERDPVMIDISGGIINAPDEIMKELYQDSGTDTLEWSNKIENIPEIKLPEEVEKNTTSEVFYRSDDAVISDFHLSDGQNSENLSVYMGTSDTTFVYGNQISAEQIAKKPEAYGFEKTDLSTVDENGNTYYFYTRIPSSADTTLHIYDSFKKNNNKTADNQNIAVEDVLKWLDSAGTQTIRIPENASDSTEEPILLDSFVSAGQEDFIENIVDMFTDSGGIITARIKSQAELKDDIVIKSAGKIYSKINNFCDIMGTGLNFIDRMNKLSNLKNSEALKTKTIALSLAEIGYTLCASEVVGEVGGAIGANLGGIIGTFFCPGAGTAVGELVGAALGKMGGSILAHTIFKSWIDWNNKMLDEEIAFAEGGYLTILIDPSGYVYEAVKQNRISDAKMTIYYKDPETNQETEWSADDFDQENPLITNKNGEYAWDVPEGLWRVKFEKDGYETVYSEWMNVPPIQTGINFSVTSLETPQVSSVVIVDGVIIVTFSKYMNISTINETSMTVKTGTKNIKYSITPVLSDENDSYADRFVITLSDKNLLSEKLSVIFADTCKSYSNIPLTAQTIETEFPEAIISLTVEDDKMITPQNSDTNITITAKPASVAAGKKVILSESNSDISVSEAVFDENGEAVISINSAFTGISELTFGAENTDFTIAVTIVTVTPEEYERLNLSGNNSDSSSSSNIIPGDVNNDGEVNLKDVVLIRRYIAGGWNVVIHEANADVNADNVVNLKDVVLIRRYIAGGWDTKLKSA